MLRRNVLVLAVCVFALGFVFFLIREEGLGKRDGQSLVGTWKLIDEQTILSDGTVMPRRGSSAPLGMLIYDSAGHVASQVFHTNTTNRDSSFRPETVGTEQSEYEAYFGTCVVESAMGTITCHVDAAVPSEKIGKERAEQFSIVGDKLTAQSRTSDPDGKPITHTLVWSRLN